MASERLTVIVKLPRKRRLSANPQRAGKNESTAQAAWAVQSSLGKLSVGGVLLTGWAVLTALSRVR